MIRVLLSSHPPQRDYPAAERWSVTVDGQLRLWGPAPDVSRAGTDADRGERLIAEFRSLSWDGVENHPGNSADTTT